MSEVLGIMTTTWLRAFGAGTAMILAAGAAMAATPSKLSGQLEPGEWELRGRGEDAGSRRLCVMDRRQLLQIQHPRNSCKTFVLSDSPAMLIVTYECGAAGGGRTELRTETPRLVQIHSQGVAGGAPFSFALEGRRVGDCR
ncbi:DUF3617 family protein [Sphingobium sp. AN558]|uniref:DUF3617 domain-containing protein n=1 Tax=Sphingobium sp. AN558 TaxID=3133442 RepID=UPI0030BC7F14